MLFTVRPEGLRTLRSMLGKDFTVIGETTGTGIVLDRDGRSVPLEDKGFEHFRW